MWARSALLQLEGTVFLAWFLRAVGVKVGRNVVLGTGFAQVVDPDMLSIGDDATVVCHFQAHTFEDRVLKIDRVSIGAGATVQPSAAPADDGTITDLTVTPPANSRGDTRCAAR